MDRPAENATPENPLVIELDGKKYQLWARFGRRFIQRYGADQQRTLDD